MLQRDYNLKDPEEKTRFHREIAKKLCGFSEEVERENYIQAVADKYQIGFDNLRADWIRKARGKTEVGDSEESSSG